MEHLAMKDVRRPTLLSKGTHLAPKYFNSRSAGVIAPALNKLLVDVFALYLKTKSFHWHVSGPHFRDYHLLFDEQAEQLLAMTDPLGERVRKLGATTIRSLGHIARLRSIVDNEADHTSSSEMLEDLKADNEVLASALRNAHKLCDEHGDIATASLIEVWLDESERRMWFLSAVSA